MAQGELIVWPFGEADAQNKAYAAAIAAEIKNTKTILTLAQMTGNATLNLDVHAEMKKGAALHVKVSVDGTNRTLTPGTDMTGVATVLTANKSYMLTYVFDGVNFVHSATQILN